MTLKTILPSGACPARIMLVADAPIAEELATGVAFSGYTMQVLQVMMAEAGISMQSCYKTHVLKIKAPSDTPEAFIALTKKAITFDHVEYNGRQVLPVLRDHILMLKDEIARVKPNVIVALGNVALWALTGEWSINAWRGSVLRCTLQTEIGYPIKVIPTYHPKQISKVWKWRVVGIMDLVRIKKESTVHTFPVIDYNFLIEPNYVEAQNVLEQLLAQAENATGIMHLSVDIETKYRTIEMIAIAWNDKEAICIPFVANDNHYYTEEEETDLVYSIYKLLSHRNVRIIGQNYNYDDQYICKYWMFTPKAIEDTMVIQHSMTSVLPKDLSFLSSMYLPYHKHWKEDGKNDPPLPQRSWYNCEDAAKTYAIWQAQQAMVNHYGLRKVVDFQLELWPQVQRMTHKGVLVDKELRKQFELEVIKLIEEREAWLEYVLGYMPNIQSPAQMAVLFYEDLLQKQRTNRKTGNLSTDDEALTKIAEAQPLLKPLVQCISELRSLGVFLNTFIRAKLSSDGRLRCSFKVSGTTTYRFASTQDAFDEGANLQNIPDGKRTTVKLPNVRELFIPDEGHTFFDVDLDSADIRIVAWDSECKEMIAMLNEGKKVYVEAMKEYYKDPTMTKHHTQYTTFKSLCHGTNYLGTAKGLAGQTGLIAHEVDQFQKWYYGKFPEILDWQNSIKDQVMKRKQISNIFGYRMLFFDRIEGTIFNEAVAWKPQCLTLDHEVLTKGGWRTILSIENEDIAIWDKGKITFEKPSRWSFYNVDDLVSLEGLGISCTKNHRVPYYNAGRATLKVATADSLPKNARIPRVGYYSGETTLDVNKLALIVALQADGSYNIQRDSIQFEFSKARKIQRLESILANLDIKYTKSIVRRGSTCFYIPSGHGLSVIYKTFGDWLLKLSDNNLDFILEELEYWDGYRSPQGELWYSSSIKSNCEWVATIAALRGKRARWMSVDNRGINPNYRITIAPNKGKQSVTRATNYSATNTLVGCPTVSSGFFLVRRNNEISVTGNSTVACIINRALVTLQKKFPPNKLVVKDGYPVKPMQFDCLTQVHDSLTGQFPTIDKEYYVTEIKKAVEIALPYRIPLTIPAEVHTSEISWGHCK